MDTTRRTFLRTASSALATLGAVDGVERLPAMAATAAGSAPGDLCFTSARELARLIRSGQLSAREVMTAHLRQIARCNPKLNAIVAKLEDDQCLALAEAADRRKASGEPLGPLHGLPIAIKDTEPVVGFPFTRGLRLWNDLQAD
jgi:amidase